MEKDTNRPKMGPLRLEEFVGRKDGIGRPIDWKIAVYFDIFSYHFFVVFSSFDVFKLLGQNYSTVSCRTGNGRVRQPRMFHSSFFFHLSTLFLHIFLDQSMDPPTLQQLSSHALHDTQTSSPVVALLPFHFIDIQSFVFYHLA